MAARRKKRPVDARERLAIDPFDFRLMQSGKLMIGRGGRTVLIVSGNAAVTFARGLDSADGRTAQLHLATATGNYRRGNER